MEFGDIYRGQRVLITGHTGFKGTWLSLWLQRLGAQVCGYSLPAEKDAPREHFSALNLPIESHYGDIADLSRLHEVIGNFRPTAVFHLAAQPLVRLAYAQPVETFAANVMGTVNLLEACRHSSQVKAVVAVTSDKCYENREWPWAYREVDPMGGHDPYSASKGCAELVIASYRRSYFYGEESPVLLASARAGNVIGGGDWSQDRLVPDLARAAAACTPAQLRNPGAMRPYQHVLEPLSGYLELGRRLLAGQREFAEGWNFGPPGEGAMSSQQVAVEFSRHWPGFTYVTAQEAGAPHEAGMLRLDSGKARQRLGWKGIWDGATAIGVTARWYRSFYEENRLNTLQDLEEYVLNARKAGAIWTK